METHHLFHLASIWRPPASITDAQQQSDPPPLTSKPTTPGHSRIRRKCGQAHRSRCRRCQWARLTLAQSRHVPTPRIRAAAAQMIFADRQSRAFISPERTSNLETWIGRAALNALYAINILPEVFFPVILLYKRFLFLQMSLYSSTKWSVIILSLFSVFIFVFAIASPVIFVSTSVKLIVD